VGHSLIQILNGLDERQKCIESAKREIQMKQIGGHYLERSELLDLGFKQVGPNARVHSGAHIYGLENIQLGENSRIDDFSLIVATGDLVVGRNVSIHSHCFIGTKFGVKIGNFTTIAPGVKVFSSSDDYSGEFMTGPTVPTKFVGGSKGEVVIGEHVIIGAGSVILPGVTISDGVSVGSLSLVKDNLADWSVYAGVPCRRLKDRDQHLLKLARKLIESE
jgi:acetyltransferase-like isoleucine patch superfamily enzyme